MDLEDQWKVLQLIKQHGAENILVLLGCPDAESSQIQAETVSRGDPSKVGPLTDLGRGLAAYHVIEETPLAVIPPGVYAKHILKYTKKLDSYSIQQRMKTLRCLPAC